MKIPKEAEDLFWNHGIRNHSREFLDRLVKKVSNPNCDISSLTKFEKFVLKKVLDNENN